MVGHLTIHRTQRHSGLPGSFLPAAEQIEFIESDRRRQEYQGWSGYCARPHGRTIFRQAPRTARITRCDLMQVFHVNLADREYANWPLEAYPDPHQPFTGSTRYQKVTPREPTVLVETETVDTGERKDLFGHIARHVITTRRIMPLRGVQREPTETITDGWYIDLDTHLSCDPPWPSSGQAFLTMHRAGEEGDVPTFTSIGEPERGYVLLSRTTSVDRLALPDGSTAESTSIVETEVTHLSTAAHDPRVFEVPAHYRRVDAIRQDPRPPLSVRWLQAYDRFARRFGGAK